MGLTHRDDVDVEVSFLHLGMNGGDSKVAKNLHRLIVANGAENI